MKSFSGLTIIGATPSVRRTVYRLLHTVLSMERAPHDAQLRVHFVPLAHMHHLNSTYKGVNHPTDVLTFTTAGAADSFINDLLFSENVDEDGNDVLCGSSRHGDTPNAPEMAHGQKCISSSFPSVVRAELVQLGDIFVSLEYMQTRCNASPSRSLPLVPYLHAAMVHATLHALGYDHTTPEELQRMVRREQQLGVRVAALSRRRPGFLPPLDVWDTKGQPSCSDSNGHLDVNAF